MEYAFISYKSEDNDKADALKELFNNNNISYWIDKKDIYPGDRWPGEITRAIDACSCFVLILTKKTLEKPQNVLKELSLASSNNKKIITICFTSFDSNDDFRYYLIDQQNETVSNIDENDTGIKRVIRSVASYIDNYESDNNHDLEEKEECSSVKTENDDKKANIDNPEGDSTTIKGNKNKIKIFKNIKIDIKTINPIVIFAVITLVIFVVFILLINKTDPSNSVSSEISTTITNLTTNNDEMHIAKPTTTSSFYKKTTTKKSIKSSQKNNADEKNSNFTQEIIKHIQSKINTISAGNKITVGITKDGTPIDTSHGQYPGWNDIIAVSAGNNHIVGLNSKGEVFAVGNNNNNQCDVVDTWKNITAISAYNDYTIGINEDHTVFAAGGNGYNRRDGVKGWHDIYVVSAGANHTVGLKSDGTVVTVGKEEDGQRDLPDNKWKNIIDIAAGDNHTVGLKSDGTVVAAGNNDNHQCDVENYKWKNIIAISAGGNHTIGLTDKNRVVVAGYSDSEIKELLEWEDIIAISAGPNHTVGLKSDGTVVSVGHNENGQRNTKREDNPNWENIKTINK